MPPPGPTERARRPAPPPKHGRSRSRKKSDGDDDSFASDSDEALRRRRNPPPTRCAASPAVPMVAPTTAPPVAQKSREIRTRPPRKVLSRSSRDKARDRVLRRVPLTLQEVDSLDWNEAYE